MLENTKSVTSSGVDYKRGVNPAELNVLGIGDLANELLGEQKGIKDVRGEIDGFLVH